MPLWKLSIHKVNAIIQERFQCGCVVLPFQNSTDWFYFEQCAAIKENIDGNETFGNVFFPNYSLKQLHATLQGQVGNVPWWKQHCSSPKEQNESSGCVNNDSCLHSTLYLETAKAASDIHRQFLFHLLAKCKKATFAEKCDEYLQEKSRTWGTVPGPGSKVHSLFYDSELYDEYLILKLF